MPSELRPSAVIHHLTDTHHPIDDGRLSAYVNALHDGTITRPDLIIHGGDLVNGAPSERELREQLSSAKSILDRAGVPVRYLCHTHDRMGDPPHAGGRSFAEIIGQPFIQHVSVPGFELYLVSGSITHAEEYLPDNYTDAPPKWGFDIFNTHVLALLENLVANAPETGGRRVLFTHLPIVPFDDLADPSHPDAALLRPNYFIGEEGRSRILPTLRRTGIRHVFGGHCHLSSHNVVDGVEFVTTPSFVRVRDGRIYPTGFRVISSRDGELIHTVQAVD